MEINKQDVLKGLTTIGLSMLINSITDFKEYKLFGCALTVALSLLLTELIFGRFKKVKHYVVRSSRTRPL